MTITKCGENKKVLLYATEVVSQLIIHCYIYKMFSISTMVTTNKTPIEDTLKIMCKESKHVYMLQIIIIINETQSKIATEEMRDKKL